MWRYRRTIWRSIFPLAGALLTGCQSPSPAFDPFMAGRSTIPPPATASPSAPTYPSAPGASTASPPPSSYPPPGTAAPAGSAPPNSYLPGGGFSVPQSSLPPPSRGAQTAQSGPPAPQAFDASGVTGPLSQSSATVTASASSSGTPWREKGPSASAEQEFASTGSNRSVSREPSIKIVEPASAPRKRPSASISKADLSQPLPTADPADNRRVAPSKVEPIDIDTLPDSN